jgi:hypothetical protein
MTYPYPAGPSYPQAAPARFKPLRTLGITAMILIGLAALAYAVQVVLIWTSIDDLEIALAEAINDDDPEALNESLRHLVAGQVVGQLAWTLWITAAIVFLVWLWQARENTEVLSPGVRHRLAKGWTIGGWFCPGVQFWFPMTIVDDIWRASAAPKRPGETGGSGGRGLIYGWWAAWAFYWLLTLASIPFMFIVVLGWMSNLFDAADANEPVDDVTVRNDIVRFVRMLTLGGSVSAGLLVVAAGLIAMVIWRITVMQDARGPKLQLPGLQPTPIQYGYHPGPGQVRPYQPPAGGASYPQDRR